MLLLALATTTSPVCAQDSAPIPAPIAERNAYTEVEALCARSASQQSRDDAILARKELDVRVEAWIGALESLHEIEARALVRAAYDYIGRWSSNEVTFEKAAGIVDSALTAGCRMTEHRDETAILAYNAAKYFLNRAEGRDKARELLDRTLSGLEPNPPAQIASSFWIERFRGSSRIRPRRSPGACSCAASSIGSMVGRSMRSRASSSSRSC